LMPFAARQAPAAPARDHAAQYLTLISMEWLLFLFAWRGLRARGTRVADIVSSRWRSARDVAVTPAGAGGFFLAANGALELVKLGLAGQAAEAGRTRALLAPHGPLEILLWCALSASAGFCEEFVFRGYLQRQLAGLTASPLRGAALSALLF